MDEQDARHKHDEKKHKPLHNAQVALRALLGSCQRLTFVHNTAHPELGARAFRQLASFDNDWLLQTAWRTMCHVRLRSKPPSPGMRRGARMIAVLSLLSGHKELLCGWRAAVGWCSRLLLLHMINAKAMQARPWHVGRACNRTYVSEQAF